MKNKKIAVIISICIAVVLIGICAGLLYTNAKMNNEYNSAIVMYNNEEYEEAILKFEKLDDFKDSEKYLAECNKELELMTNYKNAISYFDKGEFDKAMKAFSELDNYKNSREYYKKCEKEIKLKKKYDKAVEYLKKDEFGEAEKLFKSLGDYSDSKEKLEETKKEKSLWGTIKHIKAVSYGVRDYTKVQYENDPENAGGGFGVTFFDIDKVKNATGYEVRFIFDIYGTDRATEPVKYSTNKLSQAGHDGPKEFEFRAYKICEYGSVITGKWYKSSWAESSSSARDLYFDEYEKIQKDYVDMDDDVWDKVDKLYTKYGE